LIYIFKLSRHYLRQLETWLSLICAMLSLMTSIAGEFVKCSKKEIESRHCVHWVLHSISIAILMSWMQMMLLIGRVPMWGYYALMFSTVLKNILKVTGVIHRFFLLREVNYITMIHTFYKYSITKYKNIIRDILRYDPPKVQKWHCTWWRTIT